MFYEVVRLWAGSDVNDVSIPGGCAKEGLHMRGGSEVGSYEGFDECITDSASGKLILSCSTVFGGAVDVFNY